MTNTLYYGDNLNILRRYVAEEAVDFVCVAPRIPRCPQLLIPASWWVEYQASRLARNRSHDRSSVTNQP
jgi:hypothetical protein